MTTFDQREEAFEGKFAHDEHLKFKAEVRRNRLLGAWAAELIGKTDRAAEVYARSIEALGFEHAAEYVFARIRADLDAAGVEKSDHQIERTMDELLVVATQQVDDETGTA